MHMWVLWAFFEKIYKYMRNLGSFLHKNDVIKYLKGMANSNKIRLVLEVAVAIEK